MFEAFHNLTTTGLRHLAAMCRQRSEACPPTTHALQQLAGNELGEQLAQSLHALLQQGWRTEQVASIADVIAEARNWQPALDQVLDMVLSGPEAPGVCTRDTGAVMHALLAEARHEILLVGYAVHNATQLFEPLAQRLAQESGLRVWFCLDIGRPYNDTSLSSEIVRRFAQDFATRHWPWTPKPQVFYDPRSLELPAAQRSSLHAKCIAIDRSAALVTSANFTSAAQERNIEVGVIVRHSPIAARVAQYFESLCETKQLVPCSLS